MAIALVLGLIGLGTKSMWLDEAFSVEVAGRELSDLLDFLTRQELNASPYYLVLHGWLAFGTGEAAVRTLSVVFGVVAVLATYAIGRRWEIGFESALVLAVSPFFIRYEQEARAYTMLVAWSAVATLGYLRLVERPALGRALVYALLAASVIYVHPLGALVVVAHGLATLATPVRRAKLSTGRWIALFGAIGLTWLPMVAFAVTHREKIAWIDPVTPAVLVEDLVALGGGLSAAIVLVLLVAIRAGRAPLLLLWLIVPIAGTVAISLLVQPALQAKYLISSLPAAAILAAMNRRAVLAALIALSLVGVGDWYVNGYKDDWRGGVAWMALRVEPGDGVVFAPEFMRIAFVFYAHPAEPGGPAAPWSLVAGASADAPLNPSAIPGHSRIWLIEGHGGVAPASVTRALAGYDRSLSADFGANAPHISLYLQRPAGP